jgi:hypothetical protein
MEAFSARLIALTTSRLQFSFARAKFLRIKKVFARLAQQVFGMDAKGSSVECLIRTFKRGWGLIVQLPPKAIYASCGLKRGREGKTVNAAHYYTSGLSLPISLMIAPHWR